MPEAILKSKNTNVGEMNSERQLGAMLLVLWSVCNWRFSLQPSSESLLSCCTLCSLYLFFSKYICVCDRTWCQYVSRTNLTLAYMYRRPLGTAPGTITSIGNDVLSVFTYLRVRPRIAKNMNYFMVEKKNLRFFHYLLRYGNLKGTVPVENKFVYYTFLCNYA